VVHANKALKLDGKSVKAWYRRAETKSALGDHEGAKLDIQEGLKIVHENKNLKQKLDVFNAKLKKTEEIDNKFI